jgi:hypothetical protein
MMGLYGGKRVDRLPFVQHDEAQLYVAVLSSAGIIFTVTDPVNVVPVKPFIRSML